MPLRNLVVTTDFEWIVDQRWGSTASRCVLGSNGLAEGFICARHFARAEGRARFVWRQVGAVNCPRNQGYAMTGRVNRLNL